MLRVLSFAAKYDNNHVYFFSRSQFDQSSRRSCSRAAVPAVPFLSVTALSPSPPISSDRPPQHPAVLTPCQQRREKELLAAELYKAVSFIPKCDAETGAWEQIQCQPEFGLCWCVDSDGAMIDGSMVAGVPTCSSRQGRRLSLLPQRTQSK